MISALYIHIPFCKQKCDYCSFFSKSTRQASPAAFDPYIQSLLKDIARLKGAGFLDELKTLYIGGGTPSLLGPDGIRALLAPFQDLSLAEISVEVNPESFSHAIAAALKESGASRLSIGVQSLSSEELTSVGRFSTPSQALQALALAANFEFSLSVDVMLGLPAQTKKSLTHTLSSLLDAASLQHVSTYPLSLEEKTPLWKKVQAGRILVPSEDEQATLMEVADTFLHEHGFRRYEIANYAKPGHESRHNLSYWTAQEYLGLGTSAASMLGRATYKALMALFPHLPALPGAAQPRLRFMETGERVGSAPSYEVEALSAHEALAEDLMLSFRLAEGPSLELLQRAEERFGKERVQNLFARLHLYGLIAPHRVKAAADSQVRRAGDTQVRRSWALTQKGWLLANEVFGAVWGLADSSATTC